MAASANLRCWHCGASLESVPKPLGFRAECPACTASLHACRMCVNYDTAYHKGCREPMADEVSDKEATNYCEYFHPKPGLAGSQDPAADEARARLEAVFGSGATRPPPDPAEAVAAAVRSEEPSPAAEAEEARKKLAKVFGSKK